MPLYEFRCESCGEITTFLWRGTSRKSDVICRDCGSDDVTKIISRISVHSDNASKMDNLDPKYDRMVDAALKRSNNADPNRHLSRMKPFVSKKPLTE